METSHLLGLMVPSITALFSLGFLAFWLKARADTSLLAVSGAFGLITLGFIVTQYVINKASLWNAPITNIFFVTGISLMVTAVSLRRRQTVPIRALGAIGVVGIGLTVAIDISSLGINFRILMNNYTLGTLFLVGAIQLGKRPRATGLNRVLFWVMALIGVQLIAVSTVTLAGQSGLTAAGYYRSGYWLILNILTLFSLFALASVFMAGAVFDYASNIRREAETDLLTGLRARRAFERDVDAMLAQASTPSGVILFDLDHFKAVNDLHGHTAGDDTLKALGNLISTLARPEDICGRVGGEEFAIVLKDTALPATRMFAESLRQAIMVLDISSLPGTYQITASFGISVHMPADTFEETYKSADKALYISKETGRNKVSLALEKAA